MRKETETAMKGRAAAILCGAVSVLMLVLIFLTEGRPSGTAVVVFGLTEQLWIPVLLLTASAAGAAALFLLRRIRREQGKKGIVPLVFALLLTALTAAEGYVLAGRSSEFYTMQRAYTAPDGQHWISRVTRADFFGNTCYVYYQPADGLQWQMLFDADRGDDLSWQLAWGADGLTFRGQFYPYRTEE